MPYLLLDHGHRHAGHERITSWLCLRMWSVTFLREGPHGHQAARAGTKKLHVFTGERVQMDKPKGAPAWMKDKICEPIVKKVGIENLE